MRGLLLALCLAFGCVHYAVPPTETTEEEKEARRREWWERKKAEEERAKRNAELLAQRQREREEADQRRINEIVALSKADPYAGCVQMAAFIYETCNLLPDAARGTRMQKLVTTNQECRNNFDVQMATCETRRPKQATDAAR